MTIWLYSGTPGSGKSLHAASDIRFQLNRHKPRPVIGNFPINYEGIRHPEMYQYIPNWEMRPDDLYQMAEDWWAAHPDDFREERYLVVLDECQLILNARSWSQRDRLAWIQLFSQHRKVGMKVVLVAQNAKMVDNQLRMLIEYDVVHRKLSNVGTLGWLMSLPFAGRIFVRVTNFYTLNERLSSEWYIARRADMRLYDTHAKFERTGEDGRGLAIPDPSM